MDWNHVSDEEDHQEEQVQQKLQVSEVVVPKDESINISEEEEAENVTYEEIHKLELHLKALKQTEY